MKTIKDFIHESVKPENGKDWEVYVNNRLDNNFTEWTKNGKNILKLAKDGMPVELYSKLLK